MPELLLLSYFRHVEGEAASVLPCVVKWSKTPEDVYSGYCTAVFFFVPVADKAQSPDGSKEIKEQSDHLLLLKAVQGW